jgi:hypothetical protein
MASAPTSSAPVARATDEAALKRGSLRGPKKPTATEPSVSASATITRATHVQRILP